jgi:hypothetical protein
MKTLMLAIVGVLILNTSIVKSSPTDIEKCRKETRQQIVSILSSSNIEESGKITIYFYVFNKSVRIQKVIGTNPVLNKKVKELIESTGFRKTGLNGYYMVDIKINRGSSKEISLGPKKIFRELLADPVTDIKSQSTKG